MCWGGHCKAVSPQAVVQAGAQAGGPILGFPSPQAAEPLGSHISRPQLHVGAPAGRSHADPLQPPPEHQGLTTHSASGSSTFSQHPLF